MAKSYLPPYRHYSTEDFILKPDLIEFKTTTPPPPPQSPQRQVAYGVLLEIFVKVPYLYRRVSCRHLSLSLSPSRAEQSKKDIHIYICNFLPVRAEFRMDASKKKTKKRKEEEDEERKCIRRCCSITVIPKLVR